MDKTVVTCHICGDTVRSEGVTIPLCSVCGTDLLNPADETVQKKKGDFIYKRWDGLLLLTNKRLMLIKNPIVAAGTGIFGEIAADKQVSAMTKRGDRVEFSLTPNEISTVEIGKYGLFGKALHIQTTGGAQYQLLLSKKLLIEWENAIFQFMTVKV